jgi:hypothetical protein
MLVFFDSGRVNFGVSSAALGFCSAYSLIRKGFQSAFIDVHDYFALIDPNRKQRCVVA